MWQSSKICLKKKKSHTVDVEANWICKRSLFFVLLDCCFSLYVVFTFIYKVLVSTLSVLDKLLVSAGCALLTTTRDIPSTLPKVLLSRLRSEWKWQPGGIRLSAADRAAELSFLSYGENTEWWEVSGVAPSAAAGPAGAETLGCSCFTDICHRTQREGVLAKKWWKDSKKTGGRRTSSDKVVSLQLCSEAEKQVLGRV